jgi:hypothetical protein
MGIDCGLDLGQDRMYPKAMSGRDALWDRDVFSDL